MLHKIRSNYEQALNSSASENRAKKNDIYITHSINSRCILEKYIVRNERLNSILEATLTESSYFSQWKIESEEESWISYHCSDLSNYTFYPTWTNLQRWSLPVSTAKCTRILTPVASSKSSQKVMETSGSIF